MPENKKEQVLSVRDLDITFKTTAGKVHAIRGVNIDLYKGETVALVGESGSGKSVTMKARRKSSQPFDASSAQAMPFSRKSRRSAAGSASPRPWTCCRKTKSGSAATSTASGSPWCSRTP